MLRFEAKVALRHLRNGGTQTWLTIGTVALGAFLVIFMSSLIHGLQRRIVYDILGSLPNITISAPDYEPKRPWQIEQFRPGKGPVVTQVERISRQKTHIDEWRKLVRTISPIPGIVAIAPSAEGGGLISRGVKEQSVRILGVIPSEQLRVIRLRDLIVSGNFEALDSNGCFVGAELAEDLSAAVGDKIRIRSTSRVPRVFTIRGIFDLGLQSANQSWVFLQLKPAQGLLGIGNDVTVLNIKVADVFQANQIAAEIRKLTPLKVESWMEVNKAFLQGMQSQNITSATIQFVTVLAAALGVSSVLIVMVLQRSRDIGILKSMGATSKQIQRIFTIEGILIGAGGAALGSLLGTAVCLAVQTTEIPGRGLAGRPGTIVPMQWELRFVLIAMGAALIVGYLSSLFPARRASKLNPVEVIRGG